MTSSGRFPFLRFVMARNPFYLLSACLILYGLYVSFRSEAADNPNPLPLVIALCGYMATMAVTAWLVVRLAKAWDDARSILLILLLLFIPISISFDAVCHSWGQDAVAVVACGLGFSVLVSEFLLRGLRITFPLLLRVPFYLILGLFFVYPLLVSRDIVGGTTQAIVWKLLLFPSVAGVAFLSLLPAIRKGSHHFAKNGTPWRWPWFPWSLFGILAMGVCVRSYVLGVSFEPYTGFSSAFGAYFLIPFLFTVLLLLLEIGVVERRVTFQRAILLAAPLLLLAAALKLHWGSEYIYDAFHAFIVGKIGSPVWITTWGLVVFYTYALGRGVRLAEIGLAGSLLLTCFVGRETSTWHTLTFGPWWPLLAFGLFQLLQSAYWKTSWRSVLGVSCLVAATTLQFWNTPYVSSRGFIPISAALLSIVAIGCIFRDRFAHYLRPVGSIGVYVAVASTLFLGKWLGLSTAAQLVSFLGFNLAAFGSWYITKHRGWLYSSVGSSGTGLLLVVALGCIALCNNIGPTKFVSLSLGLVFFLTAAGLTVLKTGGGRVMLARVVALALAGMPWRVVARCFVALQQLFLILIPSRTSRQQRQMARHSLAHGHIAKMFEALTGESASPTHGRGMSCLEQASAHWNEAVRSVGIEKAREFVDQVEDLPTIRVCRTDAEAKTIYRWLFDTVAEYERYRSSIAEITLGEAAKCVREGRFSDFFDKLDEACLWQTELNEQIGDLRTLEPSILSRIVAKLDKYPASWLSGPTSPHLILRALSAFAAVSQQLAGPLTNNHVDLFIDSVTKSAADPPQRQVPDQVLV